MQRLMQGVANERCILVNTDSVFSSILFIGLSSPSPLVCACVFVLTPGLSGSIDGNLYGSMVCCHLWRVGEYCNCQREALACGDTKKTPSDEIATA